MKLNLKSLFSSTLLIAGMFVPAIARQYAVTSPSGNISIIIEETSDGLAWSLLKDNDTLISPSPLSISIDGKITGGADTKVKGEKNHTVSRTIDTPFYKRSKVTDHYNSSILKLAPGVELELRAWDDGAAYRFLTDNKNKKEYVIDNEQFSITIPDDYDAFVPYINDNRGDEKYSFSFESYYDHVPVSAMVPDSLAIVPLLLTTPKGQNLLVMEGTLTDYPGMFITRNASNPLRIDAEFAPVVEKEIIGGHNRLNLIPTSRKNYIAQLSGASALPWRALYLPSDNRKLADNDLAIRLGAQRAFDEIDWIKPGKVAWDWWNDWNITGVDFVAGINTETYKTYIDFASENRLEYIIIDEGWSKLEGLMYAIDELDLPSLVAYGDEKNVGIILWASWRETDAQMDSVFPFYSNMGIKGFKVDFFDRDDQRVVKSMTEIARKAAENKMVLDYHGVKATGLQTAYPNILNFEGVKGLENYKWAAIGPKGPVIDQMVYDVIIPFIRMGAGPMDYTPGAMTNASKWDFRAINSTPMSQGTRVHQMAMYTVYEAPLQMLADTPDTYRKDVDCLDFIAAVPTIWDETVVLEGVPGQYIAIARRHGDEWFIGALTSWSPREIELVFDFLDPEKNYDAVIFSDGMNAVKRPADYKKSSASINASSRIDIKMAPGGGWTARLIPVEQ